MSECLRDGHLSGDSNIVIPAQAGIQVFGAPSGSRPSPGRPGLGKAERTAHHPNDFGIDAIALEASSFIGLLPFFALPLRLRAFAVDS
jgi:hypothetical protein